MLCERLEAAGVQRLLLPSAPKDRSPQSGAASTPSVETTGNAPRVADPERRVVRVYGDSYVNTCLDIGLSEEEAAGEDPWTERG